MGADPKSRRRRWNKITRKTKKCPICSPHGGDNAKRRPKTDKYKSKRKGKC